VNGSLPRATNAQYEYLVTLDVEERSIDATSRGLEKSLPDVELVFVVFGGDPKRARVLFKLSDHRVVGVEPCEGTVR
jgi:hypothetical protein